MNLFHKRMQMIILKCGICNEAWHVKCKYKSKYICARCKKDKCMPRKFSNENFMNPGKVPAELKSLTQIEEMLIARVLPMMRVYIKPGGQRAYSGHCINFAQNISEIANLLPHFPNDLPVIIVRIDGKDNTFKDVNVCRQKVLADCKQSPVQ